MIKLILNLAGVVLLVAAGFYFIGGVNIFQNPEAVGEAFVAFVKFIKEI